jgi:hypothetical protein
MTSDPIIFLNLAQARSGELRDRTLPRDYFLACRFMHCGVIDRTFSLDQGFSYSILDKIPEPVQHGRSFAALCDSTGDDIVEEALRTKRNIAVLWSGGIDSTTALIAIMKAAEKRDQRHRVHVLLSRESVQEYPRFYLSCINNKYRQLPIKAPIADSLDPEVLNVTGELGDQLFGSMILEPYVREGIAGESYENVLHEVMIDRLGNEARGERLRLYLEPVIDKAPIPIRTLFDYLWWLNFALKWQHVILRLLAMRSDSSRQLYQSFHHFFRDPAFQQWSFHNGRARTTPVWERYKETAKQYILSYTGDETYYRYKEKEPSLGQVMRAAEKGSPVRVFIGRDFQPVFSGVNSFGRREERASEEQSEDSPELSASQT